MIEDMKEARFEGDELVIETQSTTEVYDAKYLVAALLVFVAKGDGKISNEESAEMLSLVGAHFNLPSSDSLEVLRMAIRDIAENPDMKSLIRKLSTILNEQEKEDIALMMLKVVAVDGRRDAGEMEHVSLAAEVIGVSDEAMHRAYDRYFEETATPGIEP
ncbi:MAG: putative tellurite resistance protein B-like protein [Woeseiaceae bacterium]|jgi:uncharacterized tellurite resistance protein B-like protein